MKVVAFQNKNASAEYWDYTTTIDPSVGMVDTYNFTKNIDFVMVPAERGGMSLFSKEQLRYNAQLRHVKDAFGNPVFTEPLTGDSAVAYVGVSEPVFDVFGRLMGYRHDLSQGV